MIAMLASVIFKTQERKRRLMENKYCKGGTHLKCRTVYDLYQEESTGIHSRYSVLMALKKHMRYQ